MKVIPTRNVHQALPIVLDMLGVEGITRESRNGPVIMFKEPVTTVYENPAERVMFWNARDANPFFHLFEALWMLAGRNDVESVARYVERMRSYSDDGVTFHGAYGYRWVNHFGFNQLELIIAALKANPDDRRQVLSMWDANVDLGRAGKDLPCNLQAIFQINSDGNLDMSVTNRSNDIIWGAYGANAVHFSMLHEYIARAVGVPLGQYRQVSFNFHAYKSVYDPLKNLEEFELPSEGIPEAFRWAAKDPYVSGAVSPYPLIQTPIENWNSDLQMFLSNPDAIGFHDPFFRKVAAPMSRAYRAYKQTPGLSKFDAAFSALESVAATDWRLAAEEWIIRRQDSFLRNKSNRGAA